MTLASKVAAIEADEEPDDVQVYANVLQGLFEISNSLDRIEQAKQRKAWWCPEEWQRRQKELAAYHRSKKPDALLGPAD